VCGDCSQSPACTFTVRGASAGCSAPLVDGSQLSVVRFSGRCGSGISASDGGFLGTWLPFDAQTSVVTIQGQGACLGTDLVTGVARTFVSCGACSFVAEGCD
jgi:hypothetical protein